ncbi:hypothetical protein SAMN02910298_02418 [Pseudobutyrivibrio sp. YE44]|uniref:TIGR03943 family putative permease subunit n=1 Tax=Pseudobutyrivibrio sp. YE44 TaxID=1520802 RepID=UPI00087E3FB0|nr:hypothetical protein [Pseudobutyrivibrio sp. YE44]SDB48190.1 hypothetical protein SAMN02910298_02418 [Pseudobutyrivibrio sp. YE44]
MEAPEDFTEEFLADAAEKYDPDRVFIEYNGMWNLKAFLDMTMPAGWYVTNVFGLVDASTYELYLKNMRQTIMEPLKEADAQFIGFIAQYDGEIPKEGDWVHIEAEIQKGELDGHQLIILLKVYQLQKAEKPDNIFLYF